MKAKYVIWSNEHAAWWGPDEVGYTPWVEEAGRYDLPTARAIVAKGALDGIKERPSRLPSNYLVVATARTHLMLAPESVAELLDRVGTLLAEAEPTPRPERSLA